ncbi:MAG: methyltransferase domain-containing protein [Planctomycetaceae bacterium]|nr:methyltransferase domain-containing protein [Planctomycetaceae bacterium]MCB9951242.1 methyltransferase domain-containing protein [Planctomycetaceae bacterium]
MNAESRSPRQSGRRPNSSRNRRKGDAPKSNSSTSRELAYDAILAFEKRGVFVSRTLDRLFEQSNIPVLERRLATDLACSTIRRQATLDTVLSAYCSRPLGELDPGVHLILRMGINQILFFDRIPSHAAVNESVQLCRQKGKPAATSMVNGILRSILREVESAPMLSSFADADEFTIPRSSPGKETQADSIRFERAVLPHPKTNPAGYLSAAVSLPEWLVARWLDSISPDEILRMGGWFDTPGIVGLRVNPLRSGRDKVATALTEAGIDWEHGELAEAFRLNETLAVDSVEGFAEGWFSVQDETAMQVVDRLSPKPGERILDLCAAPGGKTMHIAERMQDNGTVVACDVVPERLALVKQSAMRLGLKCVETVVIGREGQKIPNGPYDAILVDVPCSNTGVLGKRPEVRWRLTPESLHELVALQHQLLLKATELVRPGGRILYSTCSIERAENREVVDAIISGRDELTVEEEHLSLPGQPVDGGYWACIRRAGTP